MSKNWQEQNDEENRLAFEDNEYEKAYAPPARAFLPSVTCGITTAKEWQAAKRAGLLLEAIENNRPRWKGSFWQFEFYYWLMNRKWTN